MRVETIARRGAGAVMLLASLWKFAVMDFWVDQYVPQILLDTLPLGGRSIVVLTGLLGIIAGLFLLFDMFAFEAILFSLGLLLSVEVFLLYSALQQGPQAAPSLMGDIIRNLGLVTLFFVVLLQERDQWFRI